MSGLDIQELFRRHRSELLRFLRRRIVCPDKASEVLQETFIRLLVASTRGTAAVTNDRAYVFRAAANVAIDLDRSERRNELLAITEEHADHAPDLTPSPEAIVIGKDRLRILDRALAELSPNARAALLLSRCEGLPHEEIAQRLGVSESMVAKYLAHALKHCRARFRQVETE